MPAITQEAIQNSKQKIVQELSEQLPKLVEGIVAQALPKVAQNRLGPLIESQVESHLASTLSRRLHAEVEREMENTVKPAFHQQVMRVLWIGVGLMVAASVISILLVRFWPFS